MREIRTSGSMSGDGKRDQYAPGVQSTRARPRLYRDADWLVRTPKHNRARKLVRFTRTSLMDSTNQTPSVAGVN